MAELILVVDDQIGVAGSPEQSAFLRRIRKSPRDPRIPYYEFEYEDGKGGAETILRRIRTRWNPGNQNRWALVLLDVRFPQHEWFGLELLEAIRADNDLDGLPVVILSSEDAIKADRASRLEADGYLPKSDPDGAPLIDTCSFEDRFAKGGLFGDCRDDSQLQLTDSHRLSGRSLAHLRCLREVRRFAIPSQDAHLCGESGVGKTQLAAYLHFWSGREGHFVPWIANHATAELDQPRVFGQWQGAFTGATGAKRGLLELAHGGTFFLDEVANVSRSMQEAFLAIRDKGRDGKRRFLRAGAPDQKRHERVLDARILSGECAVDILFLTGTNADLERLTGETGSFRADLHVGMGLPIKCPSLNDRREDVPLLFQEMIETIVGMRSGIAGAPVRIDNEVMESLRCHDWTGTNLRGLQKTAQVAARRISMGFYTIDLQALPPEMRNSAQKPSLSVSAGLPLKSVEAAVLPPFGTNARRGALVEEYLRHLRTQVQLAEGALQRTIAPGYGGTDEYNYAGALKWLTGSPHVTSQDAQRFFGGIVDSIMSPPMYWRRMAGEGAFHELQVWMLTMPALLAFQKKVGGRTPSQEK